MGTKCFGLLSDPSTFFPGIRSGHARALALKTIILVLVIVSILLLLYFWRLPRRFTVENVISILQNHLDGTEGGREWSNFTERPIADARLEAVRKRCQQLNLDSLILEENREALRRLIQELRNL
jgi:hypothetical protein